MFRSGIDDLLEEILNPTEVTEKVASVDTDAVQQDILEHIQSAAKSDMTKHASELAALKILALVDVLSASDLK